MGVKFKFTLFLLPLILSTSIADPIWPFSNPFSHNLDLPQNSLPGTNSEHFDPSPGNSIFRNDIPEAAPVYLGEWKLVTDNAGVSAMHMVIMKSNKAVMFDSTRFGPSKIQLPAGTCRVDPLSKNGSLDCWSHAVEFDWETATSRPLKVLTDVWCSSGSFDADGNLVQAGGFSDGGRGIRLLSPCTTCDWSEKTVALTGTRWYSTQQVLPDGRFINIGGRRQFGYEYILPNGKAEFVDRPLPLLKETTDPVENNLYPFVHLIPDGTLFIFANNRAILFDPNTNTVVRKFPVLPDGSRNYPASGMSALLPLRLRGGLSANQTSSEVIVCGGGDPRGFALAEKGIFLPASRTCGRISVDLPNAEWHMEEMPIPRTMGDMLILPNTDLLLINGARNGSSGWFFGRDPVLTPLLYTPTAQQNERFVALASTNIPRMYHSTSAVLPDASILVAGSNPNDRYRFEKVDFKTEVSVERFYPPYFNPELASQKLIINETTILGAMEYGKNWGFEFSLNDGVNILVDRNNVMVTMYAPPFTTHGYSMNQRLMILHIEEFDNIGFGKFRVVVSAPASRAIAPAGWYLVYLVNNKVPSKGVWVQIK